MKVKELRVQYRKLRPLLNWEGWCVEGESEDLQNELNHVYSRKVDVGTNLFYFLDKSKMKKVFRGAMCACLASFVLASCEPGNGGDEFLPTISNPNVFILCEGLYGVNNADISAYRSDSMRCAGEYYLAQNGRYLGDTGQDILYHDGYLYVSVYGSSYVAMLDLEGKELTRYSFSKEEGQPRYLAAEGDYLYVTLYSGQVAKMLASDLSIVGYASVGQNPEGIAIHQGKLLVANSGWGYDNTVTVIDLAAFQPIKTLKVEWNPQQFVLSGDNVYLLANGQYDEDWNCSYPVQHIDLASDTVRTIAYATRVVAYDGILYLCNSTTDWTTYVTTNSFFSYDVLADTIAQETFLQVDSAQYAELCSNNVYMMEVNPSTGELYIGLSGGKFVSSGMVYRIGRNGRVIHRFDAQGANPNQAVFLPLNVI